MRPALIMKNSLDCEIGRFEIDTDEHGPLMLAALTTDTQLRHALQMMEPGDTLEMVNLDADWIVE